MPCDRRRPAPTAASPTPGRWPRTPRAPPPRRARPAAGAPRRRATGGSARLPAPTTGDPGGRIRRQRSPRADCAPGHERSTVPDRVNPDRSGPTGVARVAGGHPDGPTAVVRWRTAVTETRRDVVDLLSADHREFDEIFRRLEELMGQSSPDALRRKRELVDEVTIGLVKHSVAEETQVYPRVEKQVD